jgi:hypothetical protein
MILSAGTLPSALPMKTVLSLSGKSPELEMGA